jgi:hypothetical protein
MPVAEARRPRPFAEQKQARILDAARRDDVYPRGQGESCARTRDGHCFHDATGFLGYELHSGRVVEYRHVYTCLDLAGIVSKGFRTALEDAGEHAVRIERQRTIRIVRPSIRFIGKWPELAGFLGMEVVVVEIARADRPSGEWEPGSRLEVDWVQRPRGPPFVPGFVKLPVE